MVKSKNLSKPVISVIIPAYNEENYLADCLKTVTNQKNCPEYEVILVDNNSNDNTVKIAKKYNVIVASEPEQGVVMARQKGLSMASGEIIVSTDADCIFKDDWLQKIDDFFKKHPDANGLAGHYYFHKGPTWALIFPTLGAIYVWMINKITGRTIYASAANLSFKKSAFSCGYQTNYYQGADERGVVVEVSKHGKFYTILTNLVLTSSRRVNQGFLHSIFVTVGYYYAYNVWQTKKNGKSSIGGHPVIRNDSRMQHMPLIIAQWAVAVGIIIGFIIIKRRLL
jgi:glycosyltransferase involved in cell wall biosynthesis